MGDDEMSWIDKSNRDSIDALIEYGATYIGTCKGCGREVLKYETLASHTKATDCPLNNV